MAAMQARRATDKRTVGVSKNPKKVPQASASAYKAPKKVVVKGAKRAGRPKVIK